MIHRLIGFACTILTIFAMQCSHAQVKTPGVDTSPEKAQLNLIKAMYWSPRINWSNTQYGYPFLSRHSRGNEYNPPPIIMFNNRGDMALIWDPIFHHFKWIAVLPPYPGYIQTPPIIYGPGIYDNEEEQSTQAEAQRESNVYTYVGEVIRVMPGRTNPRLFANVGGRSMYVDILPDVLLLRGPIGGKLSEVPLGDIRPGDKVTLQFIGRDKVSIIRAQYLAATGTVQSIAANTILFDTGITLNISAETEIVLPGNMTGELRDIQVGDAVAARVAPISGKTYLIKVLGGGPRGSTEGRNPVTLNSAGPFRAGDVLNIEFNGQPGGKAYFSIPGVVANVPMTEVEPGIYRGEYSVEPGDVAVREKVAILFKSPSGATYTQASGLPITIRTMAGYLPRITFPRQGEYISSPLVVKGIDQPNALVRITVIYRADLLNALPIEGLSDIIEVTADAQGKWQTPPLSAVAPFYEDSSQLPDYFGVFSDIFKFPKENPVAYIITAASIDVNGEAAAAYSVQVTKAPGRIMTE